MPETADTALKDALRGCWKRWEDEADYDGRTDVYGLQAWAVRAMIESGECFIRMLFDCSAGSGGDVAPRLQLLEADMVPLCDGTAPGTKNEIRHGIEFDAAGRRVAYWVFKKHPSDHPYLFFAGGAVSAETHLRIPAAEMIHLFEPFRPGQLRGFPRMATVLQSLQQLADFDEATLERQKHAASLTYFIRRPAPLEPGIDPVTGETIDPDLVQESAIRPGSAYTLLPGEEIETPDLPSLGEHYGAFITNHQRQVAAAFGIPYELLTGDYSHTNDRTARIALGVFRRRLQQQQWSILVHQFCRPAWRHLIRMEALTGNLPPSALSIPVRWQPQAWPYIHPLQDVQAQAKAVEAALKSRTGVLLEQGEDAVQIDAERAADLRRERALGLTTKENAL